MKRLIVLSALALTLSQGPVAAQERGPLAMRIAFEWTGAGLLGGALVGFALWLTDPGNPHIQLSEQMAQGAAIGTFAGGAYSMFVLQRSAQFPARPVVIRDPLAPRERITSDPVGVASGEHAARAAARASADPGVRLPLFHFRF